MGHGALAPQAPVLAEARGAAAGLIDRREALACDVKTWLE